MEVRESIPDLLLYLFLITLSKQESTDTIKGAYIREDKLLRLSVYRLQVLMQYDLVSKANFTIPFSCCSDFRLA